MTTPKQLSDGIPDGCCMGQSTTDKLGFYGTAPVALQAVGTAVATTVAISTGTIWGFATSTQANALTVQVAAIVTALKAYGLSS